MYIPLFVKTDNSLLSSLVTVKDLIKKCTELNITSVAICDNNLYGVMDFYHECLKNSIKPIIGLDLTFDNFRVLLYAKDNKGYHNLIKLETLKNKASLNLEVFKKYSSNLVGIVLYEDIDTYFEINNILEDIYIGTNKEMNLPKGAKGIYVNKTLYLEKSDAKYLPYLLMIRDGKTLADGFNDMEANNYLVTSPKIDDKYLENTNYVSDICNVTFDNKERYMPKYRDDSKEYLIKLCMTGLKKRLDNNVNEVYLNRLRYELDVIIKMHFEDYFLVVYDFIKYAKKNDILVGPGRGSAAGSLVAYSLGITEVDPIKYNLLFERFLNPERITMPDIDTDFPDIDRDRVIAYVVDKYGKDKVANIITFGTMGAKQALRDVARVLNISSKDVDFLCKNLGFNDRLSKLMEDKETKNYILNDDRLKKLYDISLKIEDNKRHTSTHAAGIVISYKDIDDVVPVVFDDGINQTEYTMDYLEELGLIKMDFLGIRHLTTIKNIIDEVNSNLHKNISFNTIPLDDPLVFKLFGQGDTSGIFQFESAGMRNFLRELKPSTLEDVFAAIALYRPGPASNIPSYIKRKNKKEKIDYFDPSLENVLKPTYGIIIYQEQIILIASIMAGYSLGEADILRRAMSKKKFDLLEKERDKFITNSVKRGYNEEIATKVFELILKFAGYGFNRSHSVSYSIVSYKMLYLKAHYPKYFYANLLSSNIGSETKTKEYILEMKKLGINVKLPDVNISTNNYLVLDNDVYLPISTIRNVGLVTANYIISERENGKYKDIFDFLIRTYEKTNNTKIYESLVFSSFFDGFGISKKALIENMDIIFNYVDLCIKLGRDSVDVPNIINMEEYDNDYLLEKEHSLYGFYITSHKTEKYKLNEKNIIDLNMIPNYFGKTINIVTQIDRIKEINTKNNELMAFLTVSDMTGSISVTVFPKTYEKFHLEKGNIVKITGSVERRYNEYQIVCNTIEILN